MIEPYTTEEILSVIADTIFVVGTIFALGACLSAVLEACV